MSIDCDVAADARRVRIPVMLLQTVVENAIKHGIAELPAGGVLRIHGELARRRADARSREPAPDDIVDERSAKGSGCATPQSGLRLLFGDRASLDVDLSQPARGHDHGFGFRNAHEGHDRR